MILFKIDFKGSQKPQFVLAETQKELAYRLYAIKTEKPSQELFLNPEVTVEVLYNDCNLEDKVHLTSVNDYVEWASFLMVHAAHND